CEPCLPIVCPLNRTGRRQDTDRHSALSVPSRLIPLRKPMTTQSADLTDVSQVLQAAKVRFALDLRGVHGLRHWTRVRENGHRLAKHTGANKQIVELFAFLHD